MTTQSLLVELFVEELPPKALQKLGNAFSDVLSEQLRAQGLLSANSVVTSYATPRRLASHITAVIAQAPDRQVEQKLMPVAVGLDASGNATPALLKKLQALGAGVDAVAQLRKSPEPGKDALVLFYDSQVKGATLAVGLQKALDEAIAKLPIPKCDQCEKNDDCVHFPTFPMGYFHLPYIRWSYLHIAPTCANKNPKMLHLECSHPPE
jgi:glycyl-tRNA synthetase beta chain